jgi:hypothetical protein
MASAASTGTDALSMTVVALLMKSALQIYNLSLILLEMACRALGVLTLVMTDNTLYSIETRVIFMGEHNRRLSMPRLRQDYSVFDCLGRIRNYERACEQYYCNKAVPFEDLHR